MSSHSPPSYLSTRPGPTWPSTSPISRAQWVKTKTSLGQTVDVIKGAVTGDTAAPGALRVINASDLELARQTEAQSV